MIIIKVIEPESGAYRQLKIKPVRNFDFSGWVVFIPKKKNILLFEKNGKWCMIPEIISPSYAERIGERLKKIG